ncbi:hypothetical protein Tco_1418431 [Tanacetum coccineum]
MSFSRFFFSVTLIAYSSSKSSSTKGDALEGGGVSSNVTLSLEEFKEPEVNEYGPRDSSFKPTIGCDKESDNSKENTDDSLEQHQVTDTETSFVKSSLKISKILMEVMYYLVEGQLEARITSKGIQGVSESSTSSQQDQDNQDCIVMPIWKDASYFGDAAPRTDADDGLQDENDATEKSHEDSSFKDNVNTATPEDLVGPSHCNLKTQSETNGIELGNISPSYAVPTTPHTRVHKDHPIDHVIGRTKKGFLEALENPHGKAIQEELFIVQTAKGPGFLWIYLKVIYKEASRPDIMFAVYACARIQVSPKTSHLLAVKRIFRYLKGKPSLGLWYSKDSPKGIVAYTNIDLLANCSGDRFSGYKSQLRTMGTLYMNTVIYIDNNSDEGSLKLIELTNLVTKLSERIGVLEDDLKKTKQTYSAAVTKLFLRVKKLEAKVKAREQASKGARVVLSEDEMNDVEDVIQDPISSEKGKSEVSTSWINQKGTARELLVIMTAEKYLARNEEIARQWDERGKARAMSKPSQLRR